MPKLSTREIIKQEADRSSGETPGSVARRREAQRAERSKKLAKIKKSREAAARSGSTN